MTNINNLEDYKHKNNIKYSNLSKIKITFNYTGRFWIWTDYSIYSTIMEKMNNNKNNKQHRLYI